MVEKTKKKPGRKKLEKITVKERKLIKAQIDGKTLGQAAAIAGINRYYASTVMNKPQVKAKFSDLLDKVGLSDEHLSNKIKALTDAKDIKFFAHNGTVYDEREFPAIETQRKMTEFACKLKGHLVEKVEGSLSEDTLSRIIMLPTKPPLDSWKPPDDK
jgi:hypothetical protein